MEVQTICNVAFKPYKIIINVESPDEHHALMLVASAPVTVANCLEERKGITEDEVQSVTDVLTDIWNGIWQTQSKS
jgi:hypothetical protein